MSRVKLNRKIYILIRFNMLEYKGKGVKCQLLVMIHSRYLKNKVTHIKFLP